MSLRQPDDHEKEVQSLRSQLAEAEKFRTEITEVLGSRQYSCLDPVSVIASVLDNATEANAKLETFQKRIIEAQDYSNDKYREMVKMREERNEANAKLAEAQVKIAELELDILGSQRTD